MAENAIWNAPSAHIMAHCKCAVDSYVEYTVKWGDSTVE